MAMPKVLDWLDDLVAKVATNTTNIAKNASDIKENKKILDTHMADDNRHWTTQDRENFNRVVHFKGYFVSIEKLKEAYPTGQLGDYAIVGGSDTVWLWDDETNSWLNSTEQGIVISVNGRTGEVILTKTDVGLSNVDNTADKDKPISTAQQNALNTKADRRKITLAEADSLSLRAGVYDVDNQQKTIKEFTSSYWTVIVSERAASNNASATQIWMNYNSNSTQHIYMRKQQSGTSWSEFREILTDIHYDTLDAKIQTNIEDIGDLQVNKANRGVITPEQANATTGLKSGIYSIQGKSVQVLDTTDTYWTVIQGDWTDGGAAGAAQIWIPFSTSTGNAMFWRHQQLDADSQTRIWGNFSKVGTANDVKNLQNQINTNKNNITTNKNNITKNTNDINILKNDKADRKLTTLAELEGTNLNSGIYYIVSQEYTINQTTSTHWTIIVGARSGDGNKGASQIWIPVHTDTPVSMFLRHQINNSASWSDFVEILTTGIATREDINRFKQYKGYYALLSELKTAYPTAIDGDYAIVGSALYIWNSKSKSWVEVSGNGGGSTGIGKWSIKKYDAPDWKTDEIKYLKDIQGLALNEQIEIEDTNISFTEGNITIEPYKGLLFETYVNMQEATTINTTTLYHNDAVSIYLNNKVVFTQTGVKNNQSVSFNLVKGWNKIQIILANIADGGDFILGTKFTDNKNCLSMDCYHNYDTIIDNAYVPYVGDSTIEGNLTVEGIIGVTSKSYLQYNANDNSLSFMFNN